jgi:hypothetical protein
VIPGQAGTGAAATHRGHLENAAGALLAEDGQNGARYVHDAPEVCVDLTLELIFGHVLEGCDKTIAGIVDEHINASEALDRRIHSGADLLRVAYIEGQRKNLRAVLLNQGLEPGAELSGHFRDGGEWCLGGIFGRTFWASF